MHHVPHRAGSDALLPRRTRRPWILLGYLDALAVLALLVLGIGALAAVALHAMDASPTHAGTIAASVPARSAR